MKTKFVSGLHLNTHSEQGRAICIFRRKKEDGLDYNFDTVEIYYLGEGLQHKLTPWRKAVIIHYLMEEEIE